MCFVSNGSEIRLGRLQEEYKHTLVLLASPRLSPETRRVLDALRVDLERQIVEATGGAGIPELGL